MNQNKSAKSDAKNKKRKFDKITPLGGIPNYEQAIMKKIKIDEEKTDKLKLILEEAKQNNKLLLIRISSNGKSDLYENIFD